MRSIVCCSIVLSVVFFSFTRSHAQGETAVPFLLIAPSPDANGRGNTGTAVVSENPIGTITNPAQLGLFSLNNYFAASLYAPKTYWLPSFGMSDLAYGVWAVSGGYNVSEMLGLPFPVGIGVGYSNILLDLGDVIRTNASGTELDLFRASEKSHNLSLGIGVDFFLRLGIGSNLKMVRSSIAPISAGQASPAEATPLAIDFGILAQVPLVNILKKAGIESVDIYPGIEPLVNLTFGYARCNISDELVVYAQDAFADPLPRNATIGLSADFGLVAHSNTQSWKIITLTLAREAEDVLVTRYSNGTFSYQSGLGDISFFRQVVRGDLSKTDRASLHEGWELNLGEFIYLRGGSYAESPNFGNRNYTTQGVGIRLGGIFKAIGVTAPEAAADDTFTFLSRHFDISFDHAQYNSGEGHPLDGTIFNSLSFMIR